MIVVITGGNGFLGSNLAKKFLSKGHKVYILDKSQNKFSIKNSKATQVKCDLTNYKTLEKIKISKVDLVLHCAGQPSAALSFNDPEFDLKVNILGTLNILRWGKIKKMKKIIFASTFNVYEENNSNPKLSEKDKCEAKSLYAVSKLASENYIRCYAKHYNISWVILRMFNIFGPGQDPNNKSLGMINIFLNMAIKDNKVSVKGSLKRFRDFVFIDDVVDATILAIEDKSIETDFFNVGSGQSTSVQTVADSLKRLYQSDINISVSGNYRLGDIRHNKADISKIQKALGFNPKVTFEKGLERFVEWVKKQDIKSDNYEDSINEMKDKGLMK